MLKPEEQIFKQIDKAKNILIAFPSNWEADFVCSSIALYLFIKERGKNVEIVAAKNEKKQKNYSFLIGFSEIKNKLDHLRRFIVSLDISKTKVSQIKYVIEKNQLNFIVSPENGWFEKKDVSSRAGEFRYDLIITIGANDLESLGEIYDKNIEFFYKTPIINIDSKASNEEFGQINLVDISKTTISEIIFETIKSEQQNIFNENIATNLLAGIILQTKNFRTGKLTPETLMTTSELMKLGARREEIINQLHKNRRISDLKIWGKILNKLKISDKGFAWSQIEKEDLLEKNLDFESLKDLIEELMSGLDNIKIMLIIINKEDGKSILAFSMNNKNAKKFLENYQAEGNSEIARAKTKDTVEQILKNLPKID